MDIRDLVIEDDLFDPFEDEGEGEQVGQADAPAEDEGDEAPLIGEAMEEREEPACDTRPPRQRIYELLGQMPGQKRVLLAIVDYCREEKTGEEMDGFTAKLQENAYSVYTPVILRELLEKAGAIRYVVEGEDGTGGQGAEAEGAAEDGEAAPEAAASEAASGMSEAAVALQLSMEAAQGDEAAEEDEPADAEELARAEARAMLERASGAGQAANAPGTAFVAAAAGASAPVMHEHLASGDDDVDIEYLEIADMAPGVWVATPEGLEIVDEQDDYGQIKRLLGKEPRYQDIYQRILDFCRDEGRSAKELDNLVNDDPLLEEPRRYSGYFVGRLEREGAIQWANGWVLTRDGARILETLAEEAAGTVLA